MKNTMLVPENEEALSAVVRDAAASSQSLEVQGGGSRRDLGHSVAGATLSTSGLAGVRLYDPGALTLVVGAGTPLAEIESALAVDGQMLPFEPPSWAPLLGNGLAAQSTIGGVVATNASGPRRIQSGACRDSLIGVRFVDGAGRVLKNGGRVMKNVTGYDLVKLMCGTYGTLGVLTEVAFKLLPSPASTATVTLSGLGDTEAVRAMSAALGSPYSVSGAVHLSSVGSTGSAATHLRLEGLARSVEYRARELVRTLAPFGAASVESDSDVAKALWQRLRDAEAIAELSNRDIWRLSVRPTAGPEIARALDSCPCMYDWGGGLVWVAVEPGTDVRSRLPASIGGHATLFRANAATRDKLGVFEPEVAPLAAISVQLRAEFDPQGILNPGRMGPSAADVAA